MTTDQSTQPWRARQRERRRSLSAARAEQIARLPTATVYIARTSRSSGSWRIAGLPGCYRMTRECSVAMVRFFPPPLVCARLDGSLKVGVFAPTDAAP